MLWQGGKRAVEQRPAFYLHSQLVWCEALRRATGEDYRGDASRRRRTTRQDPGYGLWARSGPG
jgi:hypothetical protein